MLTQIKTIEMQRKLVKGKADKYQTKRIPSAFLEDAQAHGWVVDKNYKNGDFQVKKLKPYGITIGDRVWSILYKMNFTYISGEESIQIHPDGKSPLKQLVNINTVAIDNEVGIAVILTTSSEEREADSQFHRELESYSTARSQFANLINQQYKVADQRFKLKTTFVIFACNVRISNFDKKLAKDKSIAILDKNDLEYYEELVEHLGAAAKYQFLADILEDTEIPALNIAVPAIRLKVGKITYYSFAIQPEYLLKVAYIAHRTPGKKADLYAYQRMTERTRLAEMRDYIDRPAIFPTNIVINLKKKPAFEETKLQTIDSRCGILGVLKLKNAYKSAWIIDGQHRLYSYSGHPRAAESLLSVIAFEELDISMQAEFFIDINSKQKRVQPSFYQELFDQVHRDAPDQEDRIKSLISQAIERLIKEQDSAFYDRVKRAEDKKTSKRCVSWTTMFNSISDTVFTGKEHGVLYVKGNDDATTERIVFVIKQWFAAIKRDVPSWWNAGSGVGGGLAMNDSIAACFQTLKYVFQHLMGKQNLAGQNNLELVQLILPFANIVSKHLASLTKDERSTFRDYGRGTQGQTQRARILLNAIHQKISEFSPPPLKEYLQESQNGKAISLLTNFKQILLDFTMVTLQDDFGEGEQQWWIEGVPDTLKQTASDRCEHDKGRKGDKEHYIDIDEYPIIFQENWDVFREAFEYSNSLSFSESNLGWLLKVKDIQYHINQNKTPSPEQLDELIKCSDWLRNLFSKK